VARINVEDSIHSDARFIKLIVKMGSRPLAFGELLLAWIVAQKWYLTGSRMIPISEWKRQELNDALIDCGLAEVRGDFVRMAGADDQFKWLLTASQNGKKKTSSKNNSLTEVVRESTVLPDIIEESEKGRCKDPQALTLSLSLNTKNTTTTSSDLKTQVRELYEEWGRTLKTFGIQPSAMNPLEENSIGRAVHKLGFETARLAIIGQRYERPTEKFDPRSHLSIDRVLHRGARGNQNWERFKNLALANPHDDELSRAAQALAEAVP
jgi:hypothetical protein